MKKYTFFFNPKKAFSVVEMIVVVSIFIGILTVFYSTISYYSRSFLRLDDKVDKNTKAWRLIHSIQEDFMAADLPDGDPARWQESIVQNETGCLLNRKINGTYAKIIYRWDEADKSLHRDFNGETRTLIRHLCQQFVVEPQVIQENDEEKPRIRVFIKIHLGEEEKKGNQKFEPLVIENYVVPEFLNLKLGKKYLHKGIPE